MDIALWLMWLICGFCFFRDLDRIPKITCGMAWCAVTVALIGEVLK